MAPGYRTGSGAGRRGERHRSDGLLHSALVVRGTDYELARRAVLRDLAAGRVSRADVCDAHPELLRAARNVGEKAGKQCPVCKSRHLYYVSYVYGDRLRAANGRALSQPGELSKLSAQHDEFDRYVVEVCTDCCWNHLGRRELHGKKVG
jgi:hypothetical protein